MRFINALVVVCAILAMVAPAGANTGVNFWADTDQMGYQGTIWNITANTAPVATSSPRYSVWAASSRACVLGNS
jgi:hypothetical protein